ncbi:MAG TPA: glucosylceramidase [Candidatus Merdenecus merdavium]|nr:glucosylceramidase [Candidatus Merdenecus merdavium]
MNLEYITTTFADNKKKMDHHRMQFVEDTGIEDQVINIYPEVEYQKFEGFGGAFTESAGYVFSKMDEYQKKKMISTYFDSEELNYQFGRIHMDSCDFSLEQYEAMSNSKDKEMKSFSLLRPMKYIEPFIKEVQGQTGKKVELMVSPWSPPTFMKTNGKRSNGGKLRAEYRRFWADYICRYIVELRKRGMSVHRMSIQNEPAAVQTWDSCVYTAQEEKEFLKEYLYPALVKNGLEDMEIFIWDHNKERAFERAQTIIDSETDPMIAGIAFHWYSGDHFEALELIHKKFPDKKLILSEACIEYSKYSAKDYLVNAQKYAHDLIGNMNAGMHAFYDWNLVLDDKGGPNHVENLCDAPYLYDIKHKELQERNTLSYLWHFSHFIKPGAKRIAYSKYTSELEVTAFKNPTGELIVVILNTTQNEKAAVIRMGGKMAEINIKPEAILTLTACEE